jgi:hypothetical protein
MESKRRVCRWRGTGRSTDHSARPFRWGLLTGACCRARGVLEGAQAAKTASAPRRPLGHGAGLTSRSASSLINCRGTLTIVGGRRAAEVRAAKDSAHQQHVQIDELMDAIGAAGGVDRRVAGSSRLRGAAMSHATAACVAGESRTHVRIPTRGFEGRGHHPVTPATPMTRRSGRRRQDCRGNTPEELRSHGPKTAMIRVFANNRTRPGRCRSRRSPPSRVR